MLELNEQLLNLIERHTNEICQEGKLEGYKEVIRSGVENLVRRAIRIRFVNSKTVFEQDVRTNYSRSTDPPQETVTLVTWQFGENEEGIRVVERFEGVSLLVAFFHEIGHSHDETITKDEYERLGPWKKLIREEFAWNKAQEMLGRFLSEEDLGEEFNREKEKGISTYRLDIPKLYHASREVYKIGDEICRVAPREGFNEHQQIAENLLEQSNLENSTSRLTGIYAFSDERFALGYLLSETIGDDTEVYLYEVSMENPDIHPFFLVSLISQLSQDQRNQNTVDIYCNEYWRPTFNWSVMEYINNNAIVNKVINAKEMVNSIPPPGAILITKLGNDKTNLAQFEAHRRQ